MTTPVAAEPGRKERRIAGLVVPPLITAGVVVGVWYASSALQFAGQGNRLRQQPYPHDVVQRGFLISRNLTEMLHSLWRTAQVALIGLFVAMALGVAFAVFMSLSRTVERTLYPYAVVLQTIPVVAITPLIIIWFGSGQMPRVMVCVLISIFPIVTNTLFGLKASERAQHDLFTLHDANRLRRLVKLELPASIPAMFTGFRISAGLSVIGAIVGEFFFKSGPLGIGSRIGIYTQQSSVAKMIAAITLTAALGIIIFLCFGLIANRTTRHWRTDGRVHE